MWTALLPSMALIFRELVANPPQGAVYPVCGVAIAFRDGLCDGVWPGDAAVFAARRGASPT
jgi:hypothetical protein